MYWNRIKAGAYAGHSAIEGHYYVVRNDETNLWQANRSTTKKNGEVQVLADFGIKFKTLEAAKRACQWENGNHLRAERLVHDEENRVRREAAAAEALAKKTERLESQTSHVNHNFGFVGVMDADQVQALVKAASNKLGSDEVKFTVRVIDGQMFIEIGHSFGDVCDIAIEDSEVTAR